MNQHRFEFDCDWYGYAHWCDCFVRRCVENKLRYFAPNVYSKVANPNALVDERFWDIIPWNDRLEEVVLFSVNTWTKDGLPDCFSHACDSISFADADKVDEDHHMVDWSDISNDDFAYWVGEASFRWFKKEVAAHSAKEGWNFKVEHRKFEM